MSPWKLQENATATPPFERNFLPNPEHIDPDAPGQERDRGSSLLLAQVERPIEGNGDLTPDLGSPGSKRSS